MTGRRDKSADAFRTISEVANELGLATHVLRFWESKFPQIKPLKRAGGRRYYRPEDVILLRRLQTLLHDEGYTIKGVQKLLREDGMRKFLGEPDIPEDETIDSIEDQVSQMESSDTQEIQPAYTPQASLFDAPNPASPQPESLQDFSRHEETTFTQPEDDGFIPPTSSEEVTTYAPDLLPNAPEPEPVLEPEATPVVTQVIHQGLTDQQRTALEEVLSELKSLKEQIDTAA